MTPAHRIIKRLTIVLVYLIILGLAGAGFYYAFRTAPTCTDKIQNQGEAGIDCGGPCAKCEEIPQAENLRVEEKRIISAGEGKYDVLAKISNPNPRLGAAKFDYSFRLLDAGGKIVSKSEGSSFILPGQVKYVLAFNLVPEARPDGLGFEISSFEWSVFSEYEEPDIAVFAKEFNLAGGGEADFATLKAKLRNQSGFDFREISANIVIRDGSGIPVAANKTNFNDVRTNEEREVNVGWKSPFAVDPAASRIEIFPEVDVFENENFLKQHGAAGQYKSLDPTIEGEGQ